VAIRRPQDPEDAVEDTPVVHTLHTAWLVRIHRLDEGLLTVIEFIAHDSLLPFMRLNHVQADIFKGKRLVRNGPMTGHSAKATKST
jgi:hypothetical protein